MRMRTWIDRWNCPADEDQRLDAAAYLESVLPLFPAPAEPAEPAR
jgi:hypothetical protein